MRRTPYAVIGVAIVAVSFASIFIRWSESPPLVIAAFRLTFATLILLPIAATKAREEISRLTRRDVLLMVGVGGALAAHFGLWITSLKVPGVSVASSVVLVTSHPILVAVVSHFYLKERVSGFTAAGVVVGFSGVVLIGVGEYRLSAEALGGALLALAGGVMAGIYLLAGRKFRQRVSVLTYATIVYASAAAFLVCAATVTDGMRPGGDLAREMLLFLGLAVVSQIGGHTLYNWSLKYVTATVVSVSLVGEPILSSLLAWMLLSEVPSSLVAIGAIAAMAGIYITARGEYGSARASSGGA